MRKNKKIKVAILAPVFLPIPPKKQGGSEWIVYHQANGLVERGFAVSLFAVNGSKTKAKLITVADKGVKDYRIDLDKMESSRPLRLENIFIGKMLGQLIAKQKKFDVIFNHARGGEVILPLTRFIKAPVVHILHLPLFKEAADIYRSYNAPLISISQSQRRGWSGLNFVGNVYNGVDTGKFKFNSQPGD